jgi:hypothetical protein
MTVSLNAQQPKSAHWHSRSKPQRKQIVQPPSECESCIAVRLPHFPPRWRFFVLSLFVTPGFLGAQATSPVPTNHVRIQYFRPDGNYLGWTVYAFGDTTEESPEGLVADDESKCPVSGSGNMLPKVKRWRPRRTRFRPLMRRRNCALINVPGVAPGISRKM